MSSEKEEKKIINKKRKRSVSEKSESNEEESNESNSEGDADGDSEKIASEKKIKSAEETEETSKKLDEINNFMGMLKDDSSEKEKVTGDDLNFEHRRSKALDLIKKISTKKNESTNNEIIENALENDNTNKYIIYKSLKYYHEIDNKAKFEEIIENHKFCITQKVEIKDKSTNKNSIIDLNKYYKIKVALLELEQLEDNEIQETNIIDLRNEMICLFTNYYYLSDIYKTLSKIMEKNDLNKIFEVKYHPVSKKDNVYNLNYENDAKQKILNKYKKEKNKIDDDVLILMENFLSRFLFIKELELFNNNQPISYKLNLTLYYNYIMYSLYTLVIDVNEKNEIIIFKSEKFGIYKSLKKFHDLIFDNLLDKKYNIDITINKLLKMLLLLLSYQGEYKSFSYIINDIHLDKYSLEEEFMNKEMAQQLIKNIESHYENSEIEGKIDNDKIILNDDNDKIKNEIKITYSNYSKNLVNFKNKDFFDHLWKSVKFQKFQFHNFFFLEDIKYYKFLITHILSSKLFKEIFNKYNNISKSYDYIFENKNNIEFFLDKIIFLPFKASDLGFHSLTNRRDLSIVIAGYPEKTIPNVINYLIYRVIELGLRTITGIHESPHFIKSAYSIISNGKISRDTSSVLDGPEAGLLLEEILFGWVMDSENPINLDDFNISENIKMNNKNFLEKKIDLSTALKLLDPTIYDYDLNHFRKCIFETSNKDLQKFSFSNLDNTYKKYLKSFISEEIIKKNWNKDLSASTQKTSDSNLFVEYNKVNHNYY